MVNSASESLNAAIEDADFEGMGANLPSGFSKGIEENTYLAEDAASGLGDAVSASARDSVGIHSPSTVFAEIGENVVEGLVKGIEEKERKAQEAMEQLMLLLSKNAVDTITKDVKVSGESMVDSIADGVAGNKRLFTVTEQLIADTKSTAQTTVEKSKFPEVGNSVVDDVYRGIQQKETWFKQSVTAFFNEIGSALMSGLKSGIDGELKSVLDSLVTVGNTLVAECKKTLSSSVFRGIGDSLMAGLSNGISGAEAGVRSVLTGVGKRLVSEFKSLLEIKSPSKVFAKIGGNLTDGLAVGIENGEKDVTTAIGGLADSVVDNIDGISSQNNMFSDWTAMFEALKQEFKNIFSTVRDDSVLKQFDEVGKSIAAHIRQGFSSEMMRVASDMQNAVPSNFFANIGAGTVIGGVNQAGVNSSPLVTVQQMIVRSENDIRRVSQELYNLMDNTSRAHGYAAVSP